MLSSGVEYEIDDITRFSDFGPVRVRARRIAFVNRGPMTCARRVLGRKGFPYHRGTGGEGVLLLVLVFDPAPPPPQAVMAPISKKGSNLIARVINPPRQLSM